MNRSLTHNETQELFQVCKNNAVYHYDVQIEFVDHLASSIEEIWESKPEIDFETAKKHAILKFGVGSFTKIYRKREHELRKKYNRMLWKYVFEFYRWPKVVMTFVFTFGLFIVFQVIEQTIWILATYSFMLITALVIYHFFIFPKFKVKTDTWRKFLMLDQMKQVMQAYAIFIQLPNLVYQSFNLMDIKAIHNTWILLGISFVMVLLNVILYAHFFYVPQKIREQFILIYPEFVK